MTNLLKFAGSLLLLLVVTVSSVIPVFALQNNTEKKSITASFEVEPNDTKSKADWLFLAKDAYGKIAKSGDIDYWKVKPSGSGTLKIGLNQIPAGQDYNLYVYDEEEREIGRSEHHGSGDESVEQISVEKNRWYYIVVKAEKDDFDRKNYYHLKADYLSRGMVVKPDQYEPNNQLDDAAAYNPGQEYDSTIHSSDDIDFFKFNVALASTINFSLKGIPEGMDLDLYLLDKEWRQVAKSENARNKDEQLIYNGDPGTYYVKVIASKRSVIKDHKYRLQGQVNTMPVILIPGITGSRLSVKEKGEVSAAWLDAWGMPLNYMVPVHERVLSLRPEKQGSEKVVQQENGVMVFPEEGDSGFRAIEYISYEPVAKERAEQYYSMANHLQKMGYEKGKTLFAFPYDWRLSNSENARHLKQRIDEALVKSKASQVQLVAHSMGGLLVKETLLQNISYQTKTKRVIYMGTPFLGAPRAYQALRFGYNYGTILINPETMKRISQYSPSVYELLPSREFVKKQSYLNLIAGEKSRPFTYEEIVKDNRVRLTYGPLVRLGEKAHAKWDTKRMNVPQYSIVGQGYPTLLGYDYDQQFQRYTPFFDQANGDGTVPFISANFDSKDVKKKFYVKEEHSQLVRNPFVIQQVSHLLLGIEEVQAGLSMSPIKMNSYNYYVIYRQDGKFPYLGFSQKGKTVNNVEYNKNGKDESGIEYHGNVIVIHAPSMKIRASHQMTASHQITAKSSQPKIIVQQYSSDFIQSQQKFGKRYLLDEKELSQQIKQMIGGK